MTSADEYIIKLSNGEKWSLVSTEEASSWIKKFALLLQLNQHRSNGLPKLIFTKNNLGRNKKWRKVPFAYLSERTNSKFPKKGWKSRNLGALRFWSHLSSQDIICELGHEKKHALNIITMWQALDPIYLKEVKKGGFPFHAALIERNGKGFLLAASGNTGKSTCSRRIPPPWKALCDDETLIVRDNKDRYQAHPCPTWSDLLYKRKKRNKSCSIEYSVPVSAIFFLEQARKDAIVPLGQGEAAIAINTSAIQTARRSFRKMDPAKETEYKLKIFKNACKLAGEIPAYTLQVSLKGKFWKEMEKVIKHA